MTAPTLAVDAYFDVVNPLAFTLDDPVKGELDSAYVLAGDIAVDVSADVRTVSIRRGRDRSLDQVSVGVASVTANNHARQLDPSNSSGAYFGNIRPGKRVTFTATPAGFPPVPLHDGHIDDWNFEYSVSLESVASFEVVDALATLGATEFDEWTTAAGQLPGARLAAILDRDEVQFGANRAIDAGTSTLAADVVSWGSNVLNYAQLVASADLGVFFAAADGVLTFYGRNRVVTGVGAVEFRDDGTGVPFAGVGVDFGTELLFNRVSVDATGFAKQTVSDAASIALYGVRTLSLSSLPLDSAAQALDMANYLLNLYRQPQQRFSSVTVLLHDLTPADQAAVLALDIGDVCRVVYTPNGVGDPIDKFCMVEGVSHDIGPLVHTVSFALSNLADGFAGQPFTLDDALTGLLDGAGVLAF